MTDTHDLDDDTLSETSFRLESGEELVLPGSDEPGSDESGSDEPAAASASDPVAVVPARVQRAARAPRPSLRDRRAAGRLRARKVRRLVRHVEPWSVLKVSLIFYFCLWVILLVAGAILWSFAVTSGTVDNVENFVTELFALESFEFNADEIFRASAIGGLVLVVAGSGFTVLMAVLFNLISDVTGGVRFTVVEEETARPRPKRTRPRHGGPARPAIATPGPSAVGAAPESLPTGSDQAAGGGAHPGSGASSSNGDRQPGADVPILPTADSTADA